MGLHFRSAPRDFAQPGFDLAAVIPGGVAIRVVGVRTTAPQIVDLMSYETGDFVFAGNAYRSETRGRRRG